MRTNRLGALLVLLGVALLLASLALGWYQFRFDGTQSGAPGAPATSFYGQYVFFPGDDYRTYAACSGDPSFCGQFDPAAFSGMHPYAAPGPGFTAYPNIGHLYEATLGLLAAACALGALGVGLVLFVRPRSRGRDRAVLVAVGVAFLLAISGPILIWAETPTAASTDYHTPPNSEGANFTGPGGSFQGSCSVTSCGSGGGVTDSWGPLAGWYVAWAGAVVLGVGWASLRRSVAAARSTEDRGTPGA